MLCGGVASCHRYGVCTVRCVECEWSHSTQRKVNITHLLHAATPPHNINDEVFTESLPKYNFSYALVKAP